LADERDGPVRRRELLDPKDAVDVRVPSDDEVETRFLPDKGRRHAPPKGTGT
jgi:hypothetical protein